MNNQPNTYFTMKALLIVDVQNDFCPQGALGVKNGDQIIPVINQLSSQFDSVILTQDWHPANHSSFASLHHEKEPYDSITKEYGEQILWPDHCIQNSKGADFHPELETTKAQLIIRKGFRAEIDSYSAFFENDQQTVTGLSGYLKNHNVDSIYLCGLALDFCVKWSALDGIKEGFTVYLVRDASKGIDLNNSVEKALKEMKEAGVQSISSAEIVK